jgi:NADP-dependent 3-hydroxy acid dehydrogenase YdfG
MTDQGRTLALNVESLSSGVHAIVRHLCESDCHTYGSVLEWCETRGDCVYAVVCPGCATKFIVDEDELGELEQWTATNGHALVCGIRTI